MSFIVNVACISIIIYYYPAKTWGLREGFFLLYGNKFQGLI